MKISIVSLCLLLSIMLTFGGCAKPPVRNYPRPGSSIKATRPQPGVPAKTAADAPKPARRADTLPPAPERTPPPSYDKPLASIGTQPKADTAAGDSYLLAATAPLADQARRQLANGDLDNAQTTAERAVRIDPNNADLWHLMGRIQLARKNFSQAEQLARKSNLLAKGDADLQARNWRLIAESLRGRDNPGAEGAMNKAHELESR
jgi:tetratricopeptide (TPR) repeat protein